LLVGCVQTFGLDDPELEDGAGNGTPRTCTGTFANGSCYEWNAGPVTWSAARDRCASQGSQLAKTESAVALTAVASLVFPGDDAYIGASNGNDLAYEWIDGTHVVFSGWLPFNPDDLAGQCMTVTNAAPAFGWENTPCGVPLPFVCERPI